MGAIGEVCYFGSDSLEWTSIGGGHTAFAAQGSDLATASRRPVPFSELLNFYADAARQLAEAPEGTAFRLKPTS
jgi:hypothetical protein